MRVSQIESNMASMCSLPSAKAVCPIEDTLYAKAVCPIEDTLYPVAAILCTWGPNVIRKEAWPFYRTSSVVRLCHLRATGPCIYKDTSPTRPPPSQDHHRALGLVLLYGPRVLRFLMSEVPLQAQCPFKLIRTSMHHEYDFP